MTRRARLLPALGVLLPPATWFVVQQGAGGVVYFACERRAQSAGALLAVFGVGVCAWAAGFGWRRVQAAASPGANFAAQMVLGLAAIFMLADLVTLAAVGLVPPCAR